MTLLIQCSFFLKINAVTLQNEKKGKKGACEALFSFEKKIPLTTLRV